MQRLGSFNADVLSAVTAALASGPPSYAGGPVTAASTVLVTIDTTGWQSASIQLVGSWTNWIQISASNDGSDYLPLQAASLGSGVSAPAVVTVPDVYVVPIRAKWLKISTSPEFVGSVSWSVYLLVTPFEVQPAIQAVQDAASEASLATIAAAQGVGATGVAQPVGGTGILGWLSGIYKALTGSLAVTGTFWQATQPVSGTVSVSNFPGTQAVQDAASEASLATIASALAGTLEVAGAVTVSNLPSVQPVQDAAAEASLSSIASALAGTIATAGTVTISNLPVTQPVSGTVSLAGPVAIGGTAAVQDAAAETALASIAASAASIAASDAPSASWWTQSLESTQAIQTAVERGWASESDDPLTVQFDSPPVISGLDSNGNPHALGVDRVGAFRLSDSDAPYIGSSGNPAVPLLLIDTRGYSTVSIQITGTWSGNVSWFGSNTGDPSGFTAIGGWNTAISSQSPVLSTTGNGIFIIPCIGRYFKVLFGSGGSGTAVACAYLRSGALPYLPNYPYFTAVGNTAAGGISGQNPVQIAGQDPANIVRRLLTDSTGASVIAGTDFTGTPRRLLTDGRGVLVQPSDDAGLTTNDLLRLVVAELRIVSHLLAADRSAGDPEDLRASPDFSTFPN